ncbi:MAG TPA: hypothetical protein VF188_06310 [Longimicrobiales bacterium]
MKRSIAWLLAASALAACSEEPSAPAEQLYDCLFGNAHGLDVGQVATAEGAAGEGICVAAGEQDAQFVYIPFLARGSEGAKLSVEITGGGFAPVTGAPNAAVVPAGAARGALGPDARIAPPNDRFHHEFLRRERREFNTRLRPAAGPPPGGATGLYRDVAPAAVPTVGELITFNVSTSCDLPDLRTGRVRAVTDRAIIVTDTANPDGGFNADDLSFFGETFDTLVDPVAARHFGTPTDIDGNGRAIMFFTRAINELNPPDAESIVLGFFWNGDLFPRTEEPRFQACPTSNLAEMFYLLAPDPQGEVNGNVVPLDALRRIAVGTIAHEYQHLINAGRRMYVNNAVQFEDVWLNEALSHISEELVFYAASGLTPGMNVDLDKLFEQERYVDAFNRYVAQNFSRYSLYLESPDTASVVGEDATLETRGAAWAFLRYAADRAGRDDAEFFSALVNTGASGVANLGDVIGANALEWMSDWAVSVYADDAVADALPQFTQPSWNFRSILPALLQRQDFPLAAEPLTPGETTVVTLRGGSAAFRTFGVRAGQRAALVIDVDDGPPPDNLRGSILRVH